MKHIDKEILQEMVRKSKSRRECLENLGLHPTSSTSYKTLNYYISIYDIDISHYKGYGENIIIAGTKGKILLEEILEGKHPLYNRGRLKDRLINEGILERKCNNCKNHLWCSLPIPLELEHKDGNPINNKLDNLELLCPNCHAQTSTYCGKNAKRSLAKKIKKEKWITKKRDIITMHENRIKLIQESSIDFSKHGWVTEVALVFNISPQKINGWMKQYMPKFYEEKCFKRKRTD
jgi:hypothetical protein